MSIQKYLSFGIPLALFVLVACGGKKTMETVPDSTEVSTAAPQVSLYVRPAADSPDGRKNLTSLAKAMKAMREMGCDSTLSWYYQGGIHSVPHELPKNPFCPSYLSMHDMKKGWMGCTHEAGAEIHFLIWHRLYVWHLERIVRKLSGNSMFAMPYWDYTNKEFRALPPALRDMSSALYEKARDKTLNSGQPITTEVSNSLDRDLLSLNRQKEYRYFNSVLDNGPHGTMHLYIGGAVAEQQMFNEILQTNDAFGYMANVESAAFDPAFWLHHANVDFLWKRWEMGSDGQPAESKMPRLNDLQKSPWRYLFFDENGKEVSYTVEEAYNKAYNLDYTYDIFEPSALVAEADTSMTEIIHRLPRLESFQEAATALNVKLNTKVDEDKKVITMKIPGQNELNKFSTESFTAEEDGRIILEVKIGFKQQPKNIYKLYVGTKGTEDDNLAGTLSFFGALHMKSPANEYYKTFEFDITDSYKQDHGNFNMVVLKSAGKGKAEITVKDVTFKVRKQ